MSWLARSIANSLNFNDDDNNNQDSSATESHVPSPPQPPPPKGVKEDLAELTQTFTRQIWGVASFLAPPPPSDPNHPPSSQSSDENEDEELISGIRSDLTELGGKFKSGISKLSKNVNVSEFTKFASSFLQFDDDVADVVGVTEDVIGFVKDVVLHPETWLDFPVPDDDHVFDGFDMSDAQQEHALAVERLIPRLAALRMELCPGYMSENCFWKIYFVLLHPRLGKDDAELLSTPEILEARATLTSEVHNGSKTKPHLNSKETVESLHGQHLSTVKTDSSDVPTESLPVKLSPAEVSPDSFQAAPENDNPCSGGTAPSTWPDAEAVKHPIQISEVQVVDKPVIDEQPTNGSQKEHLKSGLSPEVVFEKYDDDGDDWLREESSEIVGISGSTVPIGNDEDVSFSDLEDDEDEPKSYKKVTSGSDSSTKDSRDWVQLGRISTDSAKDSNTIEIKHIGSEQVRPRSRDSKESNDWLNVDDIDVM